MSVRAAPSRPFFPPVPVSSPQHDFFTGPAAQAPRIVYTEPFPAFSYPRPFMTDMLWLMAHHGYALTFVLLLAEAMGLPFPAAIALVAAGAAVASHALWGPV